MISVKHRLRIRSIIFRYYIYIIFIHIVKYWQKINIHEHILPIFLNNFINVLAKTIKYEETFNSHISKSGCPICLKFYLLFFSAIPILISAWATSYCLSFHFKHIGLYSRKRNNFSPPYSCNKSDKGDCLFFILHFSSWYLKQITVK